MKKCMLIAGAALMVLSSLAFCFKGFAGSAWYLVPVPFYLAVASMFWRAAWGRFPAR